MAILGIDLGTTNSLAYLWSDQGPVLIKNSLGNSLTPSVVGIDDNGDVVVGEVARERLIAHPDKTVAEFKRTMGTRKTYMLGKTAYTSVELSSLVLRKIKEDAEAYLRNSDSSETIDEVIISVPAYFDDARRSDTKQAAALAGLNCERIINEPSAAALAYLWKHDFRNGTYMIVDFGGGTLDVSVIDSFDRVMEILAVAGDNQLGGKDFNEAICNEFYTKNGLNRDLLTPEQRASVYRMAEACKISLSTTPLSVMSVVINEKKYELVLDNNKLIEIAPEIFERIAKPIRKVLRDSHLSVESLEDIILVGGSCKMPTVASYIASLTGITPDTDIDPYTAIGLGAGVAAGMKTRAEEFKEVIMTDICPFSLGISTFDTKTGETLMSFIIQRNSMLPTSRMRSYSAIKDRQTILDVDIFQGESIIPANNIKLGRLSIKTPPTNKNEHISDVRMTYDINGILIVDVTTTDGVTTSKVLLSDSNRMSEAEIKAITDKLSKLKVASAENEASNLLIARAEALIEETMNLEREMIIDSLLRYKFIIANGNGRDIRIATDRLTELLDKIEGEY
ncbi:molecular chaperone HscC [Ruminococcaceae bacterium YRB3002]|nr:molecular chaperone HscC [Ruminococcaceae bacterium YRB3002]